MRCPHILVLVRFVAYEIVCDCQSSEGTIALVLEISGLCHTQWNCHADYSDGMPDPYSLNECERPVSEFFLKGEKYSVYALHVEVDIMMNTGTEPAGTLTIHGQGFG